MSEGQLIQQAYYRWFNSFQPRALEHMPKEPMSRLAFAAAYRAGYEQAMNDLAPKEGPGDE